MHQIVTDADVAVLLAAPIAVLYKHSPICPTSSFAYEEMLAFRRVRSIPVYLVDVIKHRPLARDLARRLGVVHQSPQAIVLREGVPAWHGSHYDIEVAALARAVDNAEGGSSVAGAAEAR
ncbi:MAG TPA: bacillithiol system redox-active protein YtxJ [Gemmatimonadales bacterium]|nr:bacillithiol system redox-active protein YtxJ [Gemmatimonadales bacterium]